MEKTEKIKIGATGWVMIAVSIMILFTCGFLTALVGIDYGPHEQIALSLTPGDPVGLFKAHPEPFWHLLTYGVVHLLRCRVEIAAGIVSGLLIVLTYVIAFVTIRGSVAGLQAHEIAGLDLVLHLVSAIYVPFFNKEPFLGQGSPNIWHNPTTIAVRPIALLIFVLVASMVIQSRQEEFEKSIPVGKAVAAGLLLILSCLAKPSFVQVFYPAIFTLMVIWLIMFRGKNLRTAIQLMLILTAIRKGLTWGDALAWLMLLWGTVWRLLLAEKGERMYHGNFTWGYMLAVYLVWYAAVRSYLKLYFSEQMTGNKRGVGFALATLVLVLHLVSGIYYLIYLVALGHGM